MYCKVILFIVILLVLNTFSRAESTNLSDSSFTKEKRKTLFKQVKHDIGGFGGPAFKFATINNKMAALSGGPHSLIFNQSIYLGLTFYYLEQKVDSLMFGYGGVRGGYQFFPQWPVNFGLYASACLGAVNHDNPLKDDALNFIIEPELFVNINVFKYFLLGIGVTYLSVTHFENESGLSNSGFSGVTGTLQLQYGFQVNDDDYKYIIKLKRNRIRISGSFYQKFLIIDDQLCRIDGGNTRFIINHKLALGVSGGMAREGVKINGNDLEMMETGIWAEYLFHPEKLFSFSIGGLTGVTTVGYTDLTKNPDDEDAEVEAMAICINPEFIPTLRISEFIRIGGSIGYRFAFLTDDLPGLDFGDVNSVSFGLFLRMGVY